MTVETTVEREVTAGDGSLEPATRVEPRGERIRRYYEAAGPDYRAWSPAFHMHFGWWRRGLSFFDREAMLGEMTLQVLRRLDLPLDRPQRLIDLGCGLGASLRLAARRHPALSLAGVTVVPWQIEEARRLAAEAGLSGRIEVLQRDYTATGLAAGSFDGAWALESACHDAGLAKEGFVREARRLLAPGRRLVVADGFLKGERPLGSPLGGIVRRVCEHWALETFAEIGAFRRALERHGFVDVRVEEVSWRIAPSVLHVPGVTARFLFRELVIARKPLDRLRRGHVVACVLSMLVGAARWRFGYYLVSARAAA